MEQDERGKKGAKAKASAKDVYGQILEHKAKELVKKEIAEREAVIINRMYQEEQEAAQRRRTEILAKKSRARYEKKQVVLRDRECAHSMNSHLAEAQRMQVNIMQEQVASFKQQREMQTEHDRAHNKLLADAKRAWLRKKDRQKREVALQQAEEREQMAHVNQERAEENRDLYDHIFQFSHSFDQIHSKNIQRRVNGSSFEHFVICCVGVSSIFQWHIFAQ